MIVDIPLDQSPSASDRRNAILDLIGWLNADGTAKALLAIDLLALTDRDIEAIFGRSVGARHLPHLGPVS
ncbi:MAG: hypothetical protein B7Z57_11680 [Acidiphilium sp. 37-60-79]|nr:MAG: hypothetical protein B7Z57_11680 [Acidiphilium sp. 37-60-79]OZB40873.1 MAG: hypothetical protein B7X48_03350 [Acidiphilium sp. 34-60-192]